MNRDTVDKIAATARDNGLDAIIAMSPENFAYLSGFLVPSHQALRWRHAMALVRPNGEIAVFTVDAEAASVAVRLPGVPLTSWSEFSDEAIDVLAGMLWDLSLGSGRIGIETDYLPSRDLVTLGNALPRAEFVAAEDIFARARVIKTGRELELLRRAARIADESVGAALARADVGTTELQIAAELARGAYERGAEDLTGMIVGTGERSQIAHARPVPRTLQGSDVCRVGISTVLSGYHGSVCRSACVGEPPPHAERIWSILTDATEALLQIIRPGASTLTLYRKYLRMIAPLDAPPAAFVGHGIGLHRHEPPYLGSHRDAEIEAGMVLAIEPMHDRTGHGFGLQNTDMLAVTANGAERLSDATDAKDLIRCGIARGAVSQHG